MAAMTHLDHGRMWRAGQVGRRPLHPTGYRPGQGPSDTSEHLKAPQKSCCPHWPTVPLQAYSHVVSVRSWAALMLVVAIVAPSPAGAAGGAASGPPAAGHPAAVFGRPGPGGAGGPPH